ncbi:MAG: hypothetical protein ABJH45_17025 [Paracoccaceae bacterium]
MPDIAYPKDMVADAPFLEVAMPSPDLPITVDVTGPPTVDLKAVIGSGAAKVLCGWLLLQPARNEPSPAPNGATG